MLASSPGHGRRTPRWALFAAALLATVLVPLLAQAVMADGYEPAQPWEFGSEWGWYEGDRIDYYDLGIARNATAPAYRLVDQAGNPIEGQHLIFADLRPGVLVGAPISGNYSDFHRVWDVRAPSGYVPNDLRSFSDLLDLELAMTERDLVLNTPMVPGGSVLRGQDAELHPLLQGWWDGNAVHYWRFETSLETPGLFDPGTGLVRTAPAYAVYDPPGQLEVFSTSPGEATYTPLAHLLIFNPISTLFVPDSVRSAGEVLDLGVPTFPEGHFYNRPVVGGREAYPRYAHAAAPTYGLRDAFYSATSKSIFYDMGQMTGGVAPLYRFVDWEGHPILTQHWLVASVAPDVLVGDVNTQGYSTLWCFYNVVVENLTRFSPDTIKSMEDVLALDLAIEPTEEYIVAPMVPRDPVFLPAPSRPPGDGLALTWYRGADVYLVVLGDAPVVNGTLGGPDGPELRTVNLTVLLDGDGKPYAEQRPIMEDLPEVGNYSMVWSVVWASGGDGYHAGRFRTTHQLAERGWSFEGSGQRILGGFIAGPINIPAWKPERFTFVVGPVVDEDGTPLKGANVRVTMSIEVVQGTTDGQGKVSFEVDSSWNGKTVVTFISRTGFYNVEFPAEIEDYEHFVPSGGYVPPMVQLDAGTSIDAGTALAIAGVLVVIIVLVLALGRGRTRRGGRITEEEADEIFSEDPVDGVGEGTGKDDDEGDVDGAMDVAGEVHDRD